MRYRPLRWLALCGALAIAPGAGRALAQDGQPPTGPPVTDPRTNNNVVNEARPITDTIPQESSRLLTPVPATAADPAPAGTRGVRVDLPPGRVVAPAAGIPAPGGAGAPAATMATPVAGVQTIEGVVTQIMAGGRVLPGEQLRVSVDPSQDWASFVTRGPMGYSARSRGPGDEPLTSPGIDMAITQRSFLSSHERTSEGYDLLGIMPPPSGASQTANRNQSPAQFRATPVGVQSIQPGSFVSVRFRNAGPVNEVLNMSLISVPSIEGRTAATRTPAPRVAPVGPRMAPAAPPATAGITVRGSRYVPPTTRRIVPAPAVVAPVRVPTVPTVPAAPYVGPQ